MGCLLWIILFLIIYFMGRCAPARMEPRSHHNAILDSIKWRDHNRHDLWLTDTSGQTIRIRNDYPQMTRPRYRVGGKYHVTWDPRYGNPFRDSTIKVPVAVRPGWRSMS